MYWCMLVCALCVFRVPYSYTTSLRPYFHINTVSTRVCLPFASFTSILICLLSTSHHATKTVSQGSKEGSQVPEDRSQTWRQETPEEAKAVVLYVHLQSAQAGASGHWRQLQGNVNHELVRERLV
jgi:hypothetical protein